MDSDNIRIHTITVERKLLSHFQARIDEGKEQKQDFLFLYYSFVNGKTSLTVQMVCVSVLHIHLLALWCIVRLIITLL